MTFPPSPIKIAHQDFVVEPLDDETAQAEDLYADIDIDKQRIRIQASLPPALMAEKVIHELLHGCYNIWKIGARWGEERTVTALAPALATVFKDNPKLVSWLAQALM